MYINSVLIDETENVISVDITDGSLTSVEVWGCSTDKVSIDLTSLNPDADGKYIFDITAAEVGVTSFNGLFFLNFFSDSEVGETDCCGNEIIKLSAVAGNFSAYHECLLSRTLAIDFSGCNQVNKNCSECEDENEVYYISSLLSSLYSAIRFQRFDAACKIISLLQSFCDVCDICPPYYNENLSVDSDFFSSVDDVIGDDCVDNSASPCETGINIGSGYGVGTINNLIIVV